MCAAKSDKSAAKKPASRGRKGGAEIATGPIKTFSFAKSFAAFRSGDLVDSFTGRKRIRRSFGQIKEIADMPNLIEIQRQSYESFLQADTYADDRRLQGLHEVFTSVFPIKDFADKAEIDFVKYELEEPKYDVDECRQRGMTYSAPLRVTLRLSVFDVDEDTGLRSIRDIKEQDV